MASPPRSHMTPHVPFARTALRNAAAAAAVTPAKYALFQMYENAAWQHPTVEGRINDVLDFADLDVSTGASNDYGAAINQSAAEVWALFCASSCSNDPQLMSMLTAEEQAGVFRGQGRYIQLRAQAEAMKGYVQQQPQGYAQPQGQYVPQLPSGVGGYPHQQQPQSNGGYMPGRRQPALGGYTAQPAYPAQRQVPAMHGANTMPAPSTNRAPTMGEVAECQPSQFASGNWSPKLGTVVGDPIVGSINRPATSPQLAHTAKPTMTTQHAAPTPQLTYRETMMTMIHSSCFKDIGDVVIMEYKNHATHPLLPLPPEKGISVSPHYAGIDLMVNRVADATTRATDRNSTLVKGGVKLVEVSGSYAHHLPNYSMIDGGKADLNEAFGQALAASNPELDLVDNTIVSSIDVVSDSFVLTDDISACFNGVRRAPVTHSQILAALTMYRSIVSARAYQQLISRIDALVNDVWTFTMGMPASTRVDAYFTSAIDGGEILRNNGYVAEAAYWTEDLPMVISRKLLSVYSSVEVINSLSAEENVNLTGHSATGYSVRIVKLPISSNQMVFGSSTLCRGLVRKEVTPSLHRLVSRLIEDTESYSRVLISTNDAQFLEVFQTTQPDVYALARKHL